MWRIVAPDTRHNAFVIQPHRSTDRTFDFDQVAVKAREILGVVICLKKWQEIETTKLLKHTIMVQEVDEGGRCQKSANEVWFGSAFTNF